MTRFVEDAEASILLVDPSAGLESTPCPQIMDPRGRRHEPMTAFRANDLAAGHQRSIRHDGLKLPVNDDRPFGAIGAIPRQASGLS
ncbi:hypothetical protein FAM22020_001034 [Propionibacterium freudenreichii]|uniref:hypothetical protein n=1 Tax=Propionibacterium freudenreichii TaxID=1744 RepID=UPI000B0B6D53|nr:hypothetical protein [Propionibacterium freudenreichii]MDK9300350.1 hypothetical protein [Propionibacterium freudenreichii]MDK9302135.1 hypothetical protein [Propionibacterium freudenreichii]MDK9322052.1 hypothetical protein [Propionibacterium freudenreichii]MDK9323561.1 hypothetical protein [Propionibacterium freudenreichii]MDK9340270.1 hypothetical protein [Propionibacterium freudenreichii]